MDPDDERRWLFLERLSETANVTESAKAAGVGRRTVYDWRAADPDFAKAWEEANELGTDALEDEATRRGHEGVDEPVYFKGVVCGSVRRYSDTLLIFMLKARRPDKFKDRVANEVSGITGGPVVSEIEIVYHSPAAISNATGGDGSEVARAIEGPVELPSGPAQGVAE